jgi:hypothetical protein
MMRRTVLSLLVLVLVVAACGTEPAPLRVTMTANPTTFHMGDTVSLRLVITNVSTEDQQVAHGACGPWFRVMGGAFRQVPVPQRPCIGVLLNPTITPGDSLVLLDRWDGVETFFEDVPGVRLRIYAKPGDYVLVPSNFDANASASAVAVRMLP